MEHSAPGDRVGLEPADEAPLSCPFLGSLKQKEPFVLPLRLNCFTSFAPSLYQACVVISKESYSASEMCMATKKGHSWQFAVLSPPLPNYLPFSSSSLSPPPYPPLGPQNQSSNNGPFMHRLPRTGRQKGARLADLDALPSHVSKSRTQKRTCPVLSPSTVVLGLVPPQLLGRTFHLKQNSRGSSQHESRATLLGFSSEF